MAIAFDAKSQLTATSSTADPGEWTHTPTGTSAGVVVMITQGGSTTDQTAGVTYGGTAMTRIDSQPMSGEPGRSYLYFLGTAVPSGAQTVSVDRSGANSYSATAVTVTADSGSTEVDISNSGTGTTTNPTFTLNYTDSLADWIAIICMTDGAQGVTGFSINTGTSLYENDHGAQCGGYSYLEGTGGTTTSFTTTSSNSSWSWVGVVLKEASDPNANPTAAIAATVAQSITGDIKPVVQVANATATAENAKIIIGPTAGSVVAVLSVDAPSRTIISNVQSADAVTASDNIQAKIDVPVGTASLTAVAEQPTIQTGGQEDPTAKPSAAISSAIANNLSAGIFASAACP